MSDGRIGKPRPVPPPKPPATPPPTPRRSSPATSSPATSSPATSSPATPSAGTPRYEPRRIPPPRYEPTPRPASTNAYVPDVRPRPRVKPVRPPRRPFGDLFHRPRKPPKPKRATYVPEPPRPVTPVVPVAVRPAPVRVPPAPKPTPKPAPPAVPPPPKPRTPSVAELARSAGTVVDDAVTLDPMWSWSEFVERAGAPDSTTAGHGRREDEQAWTGAGWSEALQLANDGWTTHVPDADLAVADLRSRMTDAVASMNLVQIADTSGSEVDVAAYLGGIPECMLETEVRQMSTQGRVVTFVVPASYSSSAAHAAIVNRGKALCALCVAIVAAGHSVEVWSAFASHCPELDARCTAAARVISAGEPFDPSRLMFAMAHPAMLRRLWCGVWDSADARVAGAMADSLYGAAPYDCALGDLPDVVGDAYVFPYLEAGDGRWSDWESALSWSLSLFTELGLLVETG